MTGLLLIAYLAIAALHALMFWRVLWVESETLIECRALTFGEGAHHLVVAIVLSCAWPLLVCMWLFDSDTYWGAEAIGWGAVRPRVPVSRAEYTRMQVERDEWRTRALESQGSRGH